MKDSCPPIYIYIYTLTCSVRMALDVRALFFNIFFELLALYPYIGHVILNSPPIYIYIYIARERERESKSGQRE